MDSPRPRQSTGSTESAVCSSPTAWGRWRPGRAGGGGHAAASNLSASTDEPAIPKTDRAVAAPAGGLPGRRAAAALSHVAPEARCEKRVTPAHPHPFSVAAGVRAVQYRNVYRLALESLLDIVDQGLRRPRRSLNAQSMTACRPVFGSARKALANQLQTHRVFGPPSPGQKCPGLIEASCLRLRNGATPASSPGQKCPGLIEAGCPTQQLVASSALSGAEMPRPH